MPAARVDRREIFKEPALGTRREDDDGIWLRDKGHPLVPFGENRNNFTGQEGAFRDGVGEGQHRVLP